MNIHRRIVGYYRPFLPGILGALAVLIISIGFNLLKPWPLKYVVDSLLVGDAPLPWWLATDTRQGALFAAAVGLVVIHLLWGLLNMVSNFWLIEIGLRAMVRLRSECFEKLHLLSLAFHNQGNSSDLVYRVAYDSQAIQTFFNRGFGTVVGSGLTLVAIFGVMWSMNPFLSLLSMGVVPLLLGAIFIFAKRVRDDSRSVQEMESAVLRRINDSLRNLRLVRVMTRRASENEAFRAACAASLGASRRLNRTNLGSTLVVGLITAFGSAVLLYFGAGEVMADRLKVGDLLVFLSYLAMFYAPLEQLSYTAWAMEGAAAGADRVFTVLDDPRIEDEGRTLPNIPPLRGKIEFDRVAFAYEADVPILTDISFSIEPGQTVAFVGGTGAGKTTLLSLLPRLYDAGSGTIRIDGHDVSAFNRSSLRRQMSMVLQETLLLDGTVRDNLLYARPEADDEACWSALADAQADSFVRSLPDQLDSLIGEQGARLSGGQRQRLGIARAILRGSPLLLLDEPTSSLDARTESELMGALRTAANRATTLIVTHRLNIIHHCDCIHVLDGGKLVESGTGPELLARGGVYAGLWQAST